MSALFSEDDVKANPVFTALSTGNRPIAQGGPLALRYPPDVAPFVGLQEHSPEAFGQMASLIEENGRAVLFTVNEITTPSTFDLLMAAPILQMHSKRPVEVVPIEGIEIRLLTEADTQDMLALTDLTKPGPFLPRTYTLGRYFGIRIEGRLAAMAGERMRFADHVEISAVCVHPDFRRKGYAELLITTLMGLLRAEGKTPVLHAFENNVSAIALYKRLGFEIAQLLHVTMLQRKADSLPA